MIVNEIFASIQGEGPHIGKPQTFVRLTGCNLRCSWCDTRYAFEKGTKMPVDEVILQVEKFGLKSVCITGGEPMMQKDELKELVRKLKKRGYFMLLETNGTLYDAEIFDSVDCVSLDLKPPSSGEKSNLKFAEKLTSKDFVKTVIADEKDYKFAKRIIGKLKVEAVLQPADGKGLKELAEKVLHDRLDARVLPQLHKIMSLK